MTPSKNCIDLIRHFEGCSLKAYPDPATGNLPITIGYGNTTYADGSKIKLGDTITQEQAEQLLQSLLPAYIRTIEKNIKVPLKQNEFDALVCFCWNCGSSNTLFRLINNKKPTKEICDWWRTHYITAGSKELAGLVKRRAVEAHLFETGELKF